MLYGFQGNDTGTRKACFQHPEAGLFAFSHLFSLGRQRWRATPLLRRGRGRLSPLPTGEGWGGALLHHHLLPIEDVNALRELEGQALFA